jgi:predicted nuclease of predicted toxin-antitoxin system
MGEPIKFYTDAHIPKVAVEKLLAQGVDIIRCEDVNLKYVEDEVHLTYASEHGRIVVTCDDDFTKLSALWNREDRFHAGIIYFASHTQGDVGLIVRELSFLHRAMESGAGALESDIHNRVIFIG